MGSVTEDTVTGDNDPDIYPREYTRRYYYCNKCGSFKLQYISTVEQNISEQSLSWPFSVFSCSFILALLAGIFWLVFDLMLAMVDLGFIIPIWFVISAVGALWFSPPSTYNQRDKRDGLQCMNCQKQYFFGSPFFTKKTNPRRYTVDDIPPAGEMPYWEED